MAKKSPEDLDFDLYSFQNWRQESARVDEDPQSLEGEERRRWYNQRRRFVRRQNRRKKFLALLEEDDPELYERVIAWRRHSPQKFRQMVIRIAVKKGWYKHRNYCAQDKPPELMIRYEHEAKGGHEED